MRESVFEHVDARARLCVLIFAQHMLLRARAAGVWGAVCWTLLPAPPPVFGDCCVFRSVLFIMFGAPL